MAATKPAARVLDMTNVKEGGARFNTKRLPEGDYLARVKDVVDAIVKNGDNKGDPQWLFTIALEKGTGSYPYYCKFDENQLWKVRNLLVAAGLTVPKKKIKLDPEKLVGKLIAVTLEDDEYEGKPKSVIAAIFPPSEMQGGAADDDDEDEVDEEEEEEEEEAPPVRKKKRAPEPEPEEEDEEDEEEEEPAPPVRRRKKAAPEPEPEEDEDEDEEEEEPTPPPAKKRGRPRKAAAPVVDDDDEEEEEEEEPAKPARRKRKVSAEELEELDIDDI